MFPYGIPDVAYAQPELIAPLMHGFIEWCGAAKTEMHPVEYAAEVHLRFAITHPFGDGNGRIARLLMNLALMSAGYPLINIQPDTMHRDAYIHALVQSQRSGNSSVFIELVVAYVDHELDSMISTLELNEQNCES